MTASAAALALIGPSTFTTWPDAARTDFPSSDSTRHRKGGVLPPVVRGRQSDEPRSGTLGEPLCQGRMIRVRVRDDDPVNGAAAGRSQDGIQVTCIIGPGVQHRHFARSEQIRVGAGSRNHAGVSRDDAAHPRRQGAALLGGELRPGLRTNFIHLN